MESNRLTFTAEPHPDRLKFEAAPAAVTVEADEPEKTVTLDGLPIAFGTLSDLRPPRRQFPNEKPYRVRVMPTCDITFTTPCAALYRHDFARPIGTTANQTLRILPRTDAGIPVEIDLPATTTGCDTAEEVEDGYTTGMSFSMANGIEEGFETVEAGQRIINCTKCTVDEVSVLIDPSFKGTTVALKMQAADDPDDEEIEEFSAASGGKREKLSKLRGNRLFLHRCALTSVGGKRGAK